MRTRNRLLSSTLATLLTLVGLAPANAFAGSITASCPSMNEGNAGTTSFTCTITIDCDPAAFATIGWAFADGSATTADSDYSASSGSLGQQCNAVGVTMHNVSVDVTGDTNFEPNETIVLNITSSVGSPTLVFANPVGTAMVQNDDAMPVCGNGVPEGGEDCDLGVQNGEPGQCCDGSCNFAPAVTCRASAGVCDLSELCPADSTTCPADAKSVASCRAAAGVCDAAEVCDGVGNNCPADVKLSGNICNASAGVCDPAETCNGVSNSCPADTGILVSECRASAGICDPAESCDGANPDCPADLLEPIATECRASAGICDPAENCDAINVDCPADLLEPDTTVCRPGSGDFCDPDEFCTGVGPLCPADDFEPATSVCRPRATQTCDITEFCPGTPGDPCPPDKMQGRCTCGPHD